MMNQRVIGASLLIAGTTIGAGMLALPMTSAEMGFTTSVYLLVGLWLYMVLAACTMVAICHGRGRSIAKVAEEKLGPFAKQVARVSLLALFWTLLGAYISGGSSVLSNTFGVSRSLMAFVYTAVLGIAVISCTKAVDYVNRLLFFVKVGVFLALLFGMASFVQVDNLFMAKETSGSLVKAIPVFFAAFGFHGSLPVLINYLHGSKKNSYISIVVGSAIPLVVYILWQAVTLGVLGTDSFAEASVGEFVAALSGKTGHLFITIFAELFAFLAIATSFLGVALSLFDYLSEWFTAKEKNDQKVLSGVITFALPFLFAVLYPKGFVVAIGFAAIALSLLASCLPGLVVIKDKTKTSFFLHKGVGVFLLVGGAAVIVLEVMNKLS